MILITAPPFPTPCSHLRHLHVPPRPPLRHESTTHRSKSSRFRRSVSAASSLLPQPPRNPDKASELRALWKRFWKVAAPYWFSEDKDQARLRLAAVFALTLATTGISVGFNFLGRDFYNALSSNVYPSSSNSPFYLSIFLNVSFFLFVSKTRTKSSSPSSCFTTSVASPAASR